MIDLVVWIVTGRESALVVYSSCIQTTVDHLLKNIKAVRCGDYFLQGLLVYHFPYDIDKRQVLINVECHSLIFCLEELNYYYLDPLFLLIAYYNNQEIPGFFFKSIRSLYIYFYLAYVIRFSIFAAFIRVNALFQFRQLEHKQKVFGQSALHRVWGLFTKPFLPS